jgi:phenylacetate-CoA ligase
MAIGNIIRRTGFWTIDFLKGGRLRKHYQDISTILENPFSSKSTKRREEMLVELLLHSVETVPFYSKYRKKHFDVFPVVQKDVIKNNFDGFKSNTFQPNELHKVTTSGSTGIPFFLFINQNKRNRNIADTLFFFKNVGYNIGDRLYFLRLWKGERKSALNRLLQNIVKVDISKMTDDFIDNLLNDLRTDKSSKYFIGIASSLETLCNYLDKTHSKRLNLNIKSFIANSEALNTYTKKAIEKYFNAPIVSRYSNEEQGIIAQQVINGDTTFRINWASYIVEIFNIEKDIPAKLGETGRIVVTDLFNYSMPLIRYDTGDIGIMKFDGKELVLDKVEGRKMDLIYDTKGELISSYSIYPIMNQYYNQLIQYQFIQIGQKKYLIKLNVHDKFHNGTDLINAFKSILGKEAQITLEYVNDIPILSSGKRKKVMNTFN